MWVMTRIENLRWHESTGALRQQCRDAPLLGRHGQRRLALNISSPNNEDLIRLQERSTAKESFERRIELKAYGPDRRAIHRDARGRQPQSPRDRASGES